MPSQLILASGSETRLTLLRNAGVPVVAEPARIDEGALQAALCAEDAPPRDIADTLAEAKARKIAGKHPGSLVLGCDQTAELDGQLLTKPDSESTARQQLKALSGKTHSLYSAIVLYEDARPIWRTIGRARMTMRSLSEDFISGYLSRNWPTIASSVGGYRIEEEGIRLFTQIDGDYFSILGLPLLPLLSYLETRGLIET